MEHTSSHCALVYACPALPRPRITHATFSHRVYGAAMYTLCVRCVCVRWLCECEHAICDSYSYSYNAHKACVDILLRWEEQEQQRVGSYFCIPYTSVEHTKGYAQQMWLASWGMQAIATGYLWGNHCLLNSAYMYFYFFMRFKFISLQSCRWRWRLSHARKLPATHTDRAHNICHTCGKERKREAGRRAEEVRAGSKAALTKKWKQLACQSSFLFMVQSDCV